MDQCYRIKSDNNQIPLPAKNNQGYTIGDILAESKDKEALDLIFHILQEHKKRFNAIDKKLNDIKNIIDHYSPIIKNLAETKKAPSSESLDLPQNILIVDDDPNVVKTFKMILEGAGYTVDTANNAMDAMRKVSRIHFDLVIVDMNLPDTLGDELAERLYAINKKLNIIMITGYSNYKDQLERNLERIEVLMKPVNPEELVAVTKRTLQKR
ncbi:response regulator [Candidatus Bathyarchaeota archaeon]|nr:MAG: response regulator [Candidatus Bathyarchaeota archaeon]